MLDAAVKEGYALLQSLQTGFGGLTQTDSETRARGRLLKFILADPAVDVVRRCGPYANSEGLNVEEEVDLECL